MKSLFSHGFLLIVILGLVLYLWKSQPSPQVVTTVVTHIDTVYERDTIISVVYKLKYITVTDTEWVNLPIDTAYILQAYHNKNYSQDTLVNDSALFVEVRDTVSRNTIWTRQFNIIRNYPIITKETTITNTVDVNGWYVGGYVGSGVALSVDYKYRKSIISGMMGKDIYLIGYKRRINFKTK